ncbi:MAG: SET domain-containing protein [Candidatus Paceibacterota bacterium]|jgi:SET domain-containing protein
MNKKRMFSWINHNLEIKETKGKSKGVFAKRKINKGETLCIFGGYIVTLIEEKVDSGIQIHDDLVLTSLDHKEPTDYVNHSCNPNAGIKGQIFLVSTREIKKGEEICFDYAMCLYSKTEKPDYVFDCVCGDKNCRKSITSNDWKIKDLQKRYKGYFQFFLQEKINKIQYK